MCAAPGAAEHADAVAVVAAVVVGVAAASAETERDHGAKMTAEAVVVHTAVVVLDAGALDAAEPVCGSEYRTWESPSDQSPTT